MDREIEGLRQPDLLHLLDPAPDGPVAAARAVRHVQEPVPRAVPVQVVQPGAQIELPLVPAAVQRADAALREERYLVGFRDENEDSNMAPSNNFGLHR